MLRLLGILLLAGSGVLSAYRLNRTLTQRLSRLDGLIALLRHIRIQVECFSLSAGAIMRSLPREITLACGFRGSEIPESLPDFVAALHIEDGESDEILRDFSLSFGKGYREEQLRECDYYLEKLILRRELLSTELPQKKKLNSTLCICAALAAVILLV